MQTTDEEKNEVLEFQSSDNTVDTIRTELREAILTKRKKNRTSTWKKNRINLGECQGNQLFSIDYINEKVKLLKKRKISLEDYRYLSNALIQVHSHFNCLTTKHLSISKL